MQEIEKVLADRFVIAEPAKKKFQIPGWSITSSSNNT